MAFLTGAVGNILGIVVMCMIIAGVMKVFQAVSVLEEIREEVKELNRYRRLEEPGGPGASGEGIESPASSATAAGATSRVISGVGATQPISMSGQSGDEMLRELDRQITREDRDRQRWSSEALDPEIVEPGD